MITRKRRNLLVVVCAGCLLAGPLARADGDGPSLAEVDIPRDRCILHTWEHCIQNFGTQNRWSYEQPCQDENIQAPEEQVGNTRTRLPASLTQQYQVQDDGQAPTDFHQRQVDGEKRWR